MSYSYVSSVAAFTVATSLFGSSLTAQMFDVATSIDITATSPDGISVSEHIPAGIQLPLISRTAQAPNGVLISASAFFGLAAGPTLHDASVVLRAEPGASASVSAFDVQYEWVIPDLPDADPVLSTTFLGVGNGSASIQYDFGDDGTIDVSLTGATPDIPLPFTAGMIVSVRVTGQGMVDASTTSQAIALLQSRIRFVPRCVPNVIQAACDGTIGSVQVRPTIEGGLSLFTVHSPQELAVGVLSLQQPVALPLPLLSSTGVRCDLVAAPDIVIPLQSQSGILIPNLPSPLSLVFQRLTVNPVSLTATTGVGYLVTCP